MIDAFIFLMFNAVGFGFLLIKFYDNGYMGMAFKIIAGFMFVILMTMMMGETEIGTTNVATKSGTYLDVVNGNVTVVENPVYTQVDYLLKADTGGDLQWLGWLYLLMGLICFGFAFIEPIRTAMSDLRSGY